MLRDARSCPWTWDPALTTSMGDAEEIPWPLDEWASQMHKEWSNIDFSVQALGFSCTTVLYADGKGSLEEPDTANREKHLCQSILVWCFIQFVDSFFNLVQSISCDWVLSISTDLDYKFCHHYEVEKAVCPPNLRGCLFTTAAADNIDHNLSSTGARNSIHGTGNHCSYTQAVNPEVSYILL